MRKLMKTKRLMKRSNKKQRAKASEMKGTLKTHFQAEVGLEQQQSLHYQLRQSSSFTPASDSSSASLFQNLLDFEAVADRQLESSANGDLDADDTDFILSQDFFCTPDYITPDNQDLLASFDCNKEGFECPKSPEKLNSMATIKCQKANSQPNQQQGDRLVNDTLGVDQMKIDKTTTGFQKAQNYVSQSAVALRCRVMPPPCIKNPYLPDASVADIDPFGNQRTKCAGIFPPVVGRDGLSRYHTDFHEIQLIGTGNFSRVFKVLKRIDGCLYAVKHSTRQLRQDWERRKALMEVQALAALGCHENIIGYYSSWFEDEQLYIQMELCDRSLSVNKFNNPFSEVEVLEVLHEIAKALQFMHERGVAHLDVKPDNIYIKDRIYKLGDFGCATLLDQSLPIEEGDARYMPQEIFNEDYNHLDKADIFSLGAATYELIRGSPLPELRSQFLNLRDGRLPLLPSHSLQFQNLLKVMIDPDPVRRPSAKELLENPIFDKVQKNPKGQEKC